METSKHDWAEREQFMEQLRMQSSVDMEAGWEALTRRMPFLQRNRVPFYRRLAVMSAAAAVFIAVCLTAGYFYFMRPGRAVAVIRPENGWAPYLVAPDGKRITLTADAGNAPARAGHWALLTDQPGIRFTGNDAYGDAAPNACYAVYNPGGEAYAVELPDGSHITLNAASSVKIPLLYNRQERRVAASGEAYFEVFKDSSHPFVVVTSTGTSIQVSGTVFNVSDYAHEPERITLISGRLYVTAQQKHYVLHAGEQALVDSQHSVRVTALPHPEDETAWKRHLFMFDNRDIRSVMRELGRRYQLEVHFEGSFSKRPSQGQFSRQQSLPEILENLEKADSIHTELKGNELIVRERH